MRALASRCVHWWTGRHSRQPILDLVTGLLIATATAIAAAEYVAFLAVIGGAL